MSIDAPVEALMIRAGASHPDRLAHLEDALSRFARRLPPSLEAFCGGEVGARLIGIAHAPLAGAKAPVEGAVAASAPCGRGNLRLWIEPAALHALIAAWSRDQGAARDVAAFTAIERRMARRLCDRMFELLGTCVAPSGKASPSPAVLDMPDDDPPEVLGAAAHLELTLGDRRHGMWVIVPHDGIAPGTPPPPARESSAPEPGLARRIGAARVTLSAVLAGGRVRLGDTFEWRPGTVVDLGVDGAHRIDLRWDGRTLFRGVAGRRRGGRMALRIVEDAWTRGDAR